MTTAMTHDLEIATTSALTDHADCSTDPNFSDPFDIGNTKNASHVLLKRWRQAALVLNASRRFRYTLDLRKEEEQEKRRRMIRAHAQVIRAALLFKLAGQRAIGMSLFSPSSVLGFLRFVLFKPIVVPFGYMQLITSFSSHEVRGISDMLKTDPETVFLWEAWQDLTLIILIIAAVASLALGIKTKGLEEGWYDGGSITFAVLLVILLQVIRGGRRDKVSIYDIVVGDVVPLKIGDQVPADGILMNGHSSFANESSMTGESKIVHKDHKAPFLMSGCKVADGAGTMLVTGVGINTEWGLLMASISEDNGEETPLQVRLNGVATFIGIVGLSVALLVLVVLLASKTIDGVIHIITAAVTIVVVAVPEGLPLAVTLTLAFSMKKMMADKALVRRLSACETMGSATTICSDKTGTLTLNQMTVVEAYVGPKKIDPPEDGSQLHATVSSLLDEGIVQNTAGSVFLSKDGELEFLDLQLKSDSSGDAWLARKSLYPAREFPTKTKGGIPFSLCQLNTA
ncbi:UNVERIFIED_CONTAM: Calcium-transporting ATPase 9, plasma membrane-type [Sesamum angustifolium]|uniref:Calcium-transporting ATPase 9, plasma membrane-type n=1 Tax=Sesamum angustifolium TaxID=2727405 RepID=A0AAW2LM47_9LAMI